MAKAGYAQAFPLSSGLQLPHFTPFQSETPAKVLINTSEELRNRRHRYNYELQQTPKLVPYITKVERVYMELHSLAYKAFI